MSDGNKLLFVLHAVMTVAPNGVILRIVIGVTMLAIAGRRSRSDMWLS